MSIASEIARLQGAKNTLKTKLNAKNDNEHQIDDETLDEYGDFVDSISTGTTPVVSKDIDFIDYDGTVLYSYTLAEMQELTELPALPSHTGLTCQGWNYTLADAKELGKNGTIGANYITDDGKTRIYIKMQEASLEMKIAFTQSKSSGVEVDWGDNTSTQRDSSSGFREFSHTYSTAGEYVITLTPDNDCTFYLGGNQNGRSIIGLYSYDSISQILNIYKVELGKNISMLGAYTFDYAYSLETITIPNNTVVDDTAYNCFQYNYLLKTFIFSSQSTAVPSSFFNNSNILRVSLPVAITSIGQYGFGQCKLLNKLLIPKNTQFPSTYALRGCIILSNLTISEGTQSIGSYTFDSCYKLAEIIFPKTITEIGSRAFQNCYGMRKYDFSQFTQIPTLGTYAFVGIKTGCKIVVPDSLYDDWKAASNWSSYASYIIKASEA